MSPQRGKTISAPIVWSIAFVYSMICIAMTLSLELRIVLYAAVCVFGFMLCVLAPFLITQVNKFMSRRFIALSLIVLLAFFSGIYAAFSKGLMTPTFLLIGFFSMFSTLGIYIVMSLGSREVFFHGFQFPLVIFGLICCFLFFLFDYQLLDNVNSYPTLFLPCLCYCCLIKNKRIEALFALAIVIFLGVYFEARLALVIGILAPTLALLSNKDIFRKCFCWLALGLTIATVYLAISFDSSFNEVLSNRVLIWQYYFILSLQNLYLGVGVITPEIAESTAKFLEDQLQRGANTQYGTQSMVIRYIYENGIIVATVTYLFLFRYLLRNTRYANIALLGYLPTLLESVKLGVPSIIGCMFLVFFLMSLTEETSKA